MLARRLAFLFVLSILVVGCAGSAKKINQLNVGMTKADVIEAMGEPDYTSGSRDVEVLTYKLKSNSFYSDTFFVRIKNGKVDRFGQQGSYGTYY